MERFQQLEALGELLNFGLRLSIGDFLTDIGNFVFENNFFEQSLNCFSTHGRSEFVAELFERFEVLVVGQQLTFLQCSQTWICYHVGFKVEYAFDFTQCHIQHQTNARRQGLEEPDVGNWTGQFNVAHALTTDFRQCHFNATFLTHNTAVLHALVLATETFVIFYWAKNFGTEKTFALGLESTVVNCLGLFNLTK